MSKPDHEHQQRYSLADAIIEHRDDVERRWSARVVAGLHGCELTPSELRDSVPEYLTRLAEGLRGSDSIEYVGTCSWENVAREHAEQRIRLGFNIDQVVQEFITLRQALFDVLEERQLILETRQATRIADLIDGAIAAAVSSYVRFRDQEARRKEAQHVSFISHELRNPLTTISLALAQLRRTAKLSDEETRIFGAIERNQRRLSELVDGILIVERAVGEQKLNTLRTTLQQIFDEPFAAARLVAEAKGLEFEARFDPEVVVEVDRKLAVSAIDNVVQNALKYSDDGLVRVVAEERPGEVVVHVHDNCPGLSQEDLEAVFQPFHRGRSTKPGTGLGLAIARRALEAQGGAIYAEAGDHSGCHFSLILPKPHSTDARKEAPQRL